MKDKQQRRGIDAYCDFLKWMLGGVLIATFVGIGTIGLNSIFHFYDERIVNTLAIIIWAGIFMFSILMANRQVNKYFEERR